ncbi:DNA ligase [Ornithinimicrobium sufpigmenti]|uniref:ATP-dependent DNA ligase n=1 Tax=Ornithinimicrobium sufpigmenti TaxID=2508882 RepID=UPI001035AC72|nr:MULTISPECIES: DNA ligase [unclassified Ornithinimicrobium]
MRPMLATPGDPRTGPPGGRGWAHEIKWDGIRLLADVRGGGQRLLTRSGRDIAAAFPELAAIAQVGEDLLLDGEAVAMVGGRPSFGHVVERVHTSSVTAAAQLPAARPATYIAFDLLRVDGMQLTGLPWSARRAALEDLLDDVPGVLVSPVYDDGVQLLAATADQGLEGVVSKRRAAPYLEGGRSTDWLKFPHRDTMSVVIGGWRAQTGTATRLGAVHVGLPAVDAEGRPLRDEAGRLQLVYAGRVGSGLAGRAGLVLAERLAQVPGTPYPFTTAIPRAEATASTWLEPRVVIDVASLGLTPGEGRLRQPSFQGVREDLTPLDLLELP